MVEQDTTRTRRLSLPPSRPTGFSGVRTSNPVNRPSTMFEHNAVGLVTGHGHRSNESAP